MSAAAEAPPRETTPLTIDEERVAHDLLEGIQPPLCEHNLVRDGRTVVDRCAEAATWACVLSCGHVVYFCDEHHDHMEAFFQSPGLNVCTKKPHTYPTRFSYVWTEVR